ncbi:hypothetical protein SCHPADRAFT_995311 [Schizopora paradoxa]|uniref:Uncharacterized protein n=1 Tax=Schizopora paradoxa TaxID=27342 RepID=A0A0H2S379_9AGAM|nr:hypothetical protein SCHPADRAFT_995311 [Schizopora paradoxa]
MSMNAESLREDLAEALRDCEPDITSLRTTKKKSPTIPPAALDEVRQLLQSWKEDMEGTNPNKLPEFLYYIPNLRAGGTFLIKHLKPIVKTLDVELLRADLEIQKFGYAIEPYDWEDRRQYIRDYVGCGNESPLDEEEYEDANFEFDDDSEYEINIKVLEVFKLDGKSVKDFIVNLDTNISVIPDIYEEDMGKPDEKSHDMDEGLWGEITLDHRFHRSALVFSPRGILTVE